MARKPISPAKRALEVHPHSRSELTERGTAQSLPREIGQETPPGRERRQADSRDGNALAAPHAAERGGKGHGEPSAAVAPLQGDHPSFSRDDPGEHRNGSLSA